MFKKKSNQTTFVYCECGSEMCSDESFISDTYDENNNNHVRYICQKCGKESDWNFDIMPGPISWDYLNEV